MGRCGHALPPRPNLRVLLSLSGERIVLQQRESLPADWELQVSAPVTAVIYRRLDAVGGRWTGQERRRATDKYSAVLLEAWSPPTFITQSFLYWITTPFGSQFNAKTAKAGIYGDVWLVHHA